MFVHPSSSSSNTSNVNTRRRLSGHLGTCTATRPFSFGLPLSFPRVVGSSAELHYPNCPTGSPFSIHSMSINNAPGQTGPGPGPSSSQPSQPATAARDAMVVDDQARLEAGPSRPRRSSTAATHNDDASIHTPSSPRSHGRPRPASPETALNTPPRPSTPQLDLATYPTQTLLRLLASLLQQIASANDLLRPDMDEPLDEEYVNHEEGSIPSRSESRASSTHPPPHPSPTTALFSDIPVHPPPSAESGEALPLFSASRVSLSHPSSLLSFHARHIPSISIESYLLRILKYCPTTNEVFLGLLVYFDRMSRLGTPLGVGGETAGAKKGVGRGFAIDSYNIHRLVIAGVTVASKFFSGMSIT